MSYVVRTSRLPYKIIKWIAIAFAFLLSLALLLGTYFWWAERPIRYAMMAIEPSTAHELEAQRKALLDFQRHGACEHGGKRSDWDRRPTLLFAVHREYEKDDVGCISGQMPGGFQMLKKGHIWW